MKEIVITNKAGITLNTKKSLVDDDIKIKIDKSILKEESKGKIEITTTDEVDVSGYETAQVVDDNLTAENIAKDVNILGVVGTYEGGSSGGHEQEDGLIDGTLTSYSNDRVTSVGESVFECSKITNIDLPNVQTIEVYAFRNSNIKTANIPNATLIKTNAFQGSGIESIVLPNVTSIYRGAFYNCYSLKTISIKKIERIGLEMFYLCKALTDVYLGYDGLVSLSGTNAFNNVTAGVKIHVRSTYADRYATATNWSSLIEAGTIVIVGDYSD
jgi:hypothetical protein